MENGQSIKADATVTNFIKHPSSLIFLHHLICSGIIMKFLVFFALVAVAVAQRGGARPSPQRSEDVTILRQESENNGDGTYRFLWETSDGSKHEEAGYLKPGGEEGIQVAQGAYEFYSPEGEHVQVKYIADENGFQPESAHLPTPPPIPAEIQKSLDIIYAAIAKGGSPQQAAPQHAAARRPGNNRG